MRTKDPAIKFLEICAKSDLRAKHWKNRAGQLGIFFNFTLEDAEAFFWWFFDTWLEKVDKEIEFQLNF